MSKVSPIIPRPKTVELILPDGFVRGAYQAGVLKVLVPHLLEQNLKIKYISARSIGSANAVLLAGALNTNQQDKIGDLLGGFWNDVGALADPYLAPVRLTHKMVDLAAQFKIKAGKSWTFPNMPLPLKLMFAGLAASCAPLGKLGEILDRHMTEEMWQGVREGHTETSIRVAKPVPGLKTLQAIDIAGNNISTNSVLSSCAARIFGAHEGYLDGTYVRKSLYPASPRTDYIISVPNFPGSPIATKREKQAEKDRARLFYDERCTLHRVESTLTSLLSSSVNFTSRHIAALDRQGVETGMQWLEKNGANMLFEQSDKPHEIFERRHRASKHAPAYTQPAI